MSKASVMVHTADGVWTDLGWWDQLKVKETRVYLSKNGGEELTISVLPSDEAADELYRQLQERIQYPASRFDARNWTDYEEVGT